MKKILLVLSAAFAFQMSMAQVVTTLHHNGQTTVFYTNNGLVDAYNTAADGDTIYLSGGHFNALTINKKITVYGAGYFPDSTAATGATYVDGSISLNGAADNSNLEGLQINGHVYFQTDSAVNNVTVSRCRITGNVYANGSRVNPTMFVTIKECVIDGYVTAANFTQCDISNNFIYLEVDYAQNCSIRNNIFFQATWVGYPYYATYNIYDCDNSLVENNIFLSTASYFMNCDNPLVRNNLFVQTCASNAGSGTFTNNYQNVASSGIFTSYAGSNFSFTDNYHLQNAATYLGSDGKEVGVYGGAYSFKEKSVPANPHIRLVNVPANTDASGNLNINISAGAQQK